jgi:FkbM family methyltransferase
MESTKLGKYIIRYPNRNEFHTLKREIWGQDCYHFETSSNSPLIIDVGAHIGISVLYFKSLYPKSKILAFEPNPENLSYLKENILINGLEDIEVIPKAISKENTTKPFYIDCTENHWNSNSSLIKGSWNGKEKTEAINVQCVRLDRYLIGNSVECLKIDTEGTELQIIKSIKSILGNNVMNIFVEYHPRRDNKLKDLLDLLGVNFNLEIYHEGKKLKRPLENKLLLIKGMNRNHL